MRGGAAGTGGSVSGEFKFQAIGRSVFLFIDSPDLPKIGYFRTQRQAAQAGREIDRAVREAIADVLKRYPEAT